MAKYTYFNWKDETTGVCYNMLGERFFATEEAFEGITELHPIVEYNPEEKTIVIIKEEINDELVELEVECFTVTKLFNTKDDLLDHHTQLIVAEKKASLGKQ